MEKRNFLIHAIVVCIVCGTFLASCSQENKSGDVAQTSSYKFFKVKRDSCNLSQSYSATIRGRQDVAIVPQVSGTITKVLVEEGQHVKEGQVMFVIDQVPFLAALRTAKANVQAAKAQLATAKLDFESNKELFEKDVISQFTLSTSENAYLTAKAALEQALAAEINASNSLNYTEVKSPTDGFVGNLPYRVGALVSPQIQEPLTTVSDNSEMWVYFSMTENQLLSLSRAYRSMEEAVASMPPVGLRLKDGMVYDKEGRIESISAVIDRSTGTVTCKAVFENHDGMLHSGLSGNIVVTKTYKDVLIIPQGATVRQQNKYIVYKVGKDGMAESVLVDVEPISDGKRFIVLSGLKEGDEILADGAGLIRPGTKLK